jgi:hypothetical protein
MDLLVIAFSSKFFLASRYILLLLVSSFNPKIIFIDTFYDEQPMITRKYQW